MVAHEFAAEVGEDRRQAGEARAVLLAAAGGKPDAAAVWQHGTPHGGSAGTRGVGLLRVGVAVRYGGRGGEVCDKREGEASRSDGTKQKGRG